MGQGMAEFATKKKVGSKTQWDLYCHYVAGLVGIGLSHMFAASGLEGKMKKCNCLRAFIFVRS
jgi:farnesyl-diphosphate farnesyltransferase